MGDAGRHLADGRELLRLQQLLLGLLQLLDRVLLPLEQLGVLDGERGVPGQGLGRPQGVAAERLRGAGVVDVEDAQGAGEGAGPVGPGAGGAQGQAHDGLEGPRVLVGAAGRRLELGRLSPRANGRDHLARLERAPHDRAGDAVPADRAPVRAAAGDAEPEAGHRGVAGGGGRAVGEQEEAPLGARDVHDRVEHLLEDLAEHERRVQGLDEGEQELLLLDPGQLGHGAGRALRPEERELQRHVAQLDLRPRGQLRPAHLGGVHVDAVQAARVLDEEAPVLVVEAGVELRDRGLVERDVVVAGAPHGVGPRLQEADLLRHLAADHLEDGHGQGIAAARAARRVERVLHRALRAEHGDSMMTERQLSRQRTPALPSATADQGVWGGGAPPSRRKLDTGVAVYGWPSPRGAGPRCSRWQSRECQRRRPTGAFVRGQLPMASPSGGLRGRGQILRPPDGGLSWIAAGASGPSRAPRRDLPA